MDKDLDQVADEIKKAARTLRAAIKNCLLAKRSRGKDGRDLQKRG